MRIALPFGLIGGLHSLVEVIRDGPHARERRILLAGRVAVELCEEREQQTLRHRIAFGASVDQPEHSSIVVGPRDLERQIDLAKLEKAIGDGNQYQGLAPTLAEDALRTAELARGLEKPRHELDGRYERAVRIAREHKLPTHELAAVYGWAWTSYFWFDDVAKLNALYDEVEKLAIESDKADDLERLCNLLPLLGNASRRREDRLYRAYEWVPFGRVSQHRA